MPKKKSRHHVSGLYERTLPSGATRWVLDCRIKGERYVVHLGELSPSIAREKAQIARGDILAGNAARWLPNITEGSPPFKDFAAKWLKLVKKQLSDVNFRRYQLDLQNHVFPAKLGKQRLADITPGDVNDFLGEKSVEQRTVKGTGETVEGYSRNSVRLMRAAISVVLGDAVQAGLIERNPARNQGGRRQPGMLSKTDAKEKIRPMNADERRRFLAVARGKNHGALFEFLMKTGCRPSEAYGLKNSDIDLKKRTIRVERTVSTYSHKIIEKTKTGAGRKVKLSPQLVANLRAHMAATRKRELKKGRKTEWLFPSEVGTVLYHENVRKAFHRRLREAGLPAFRVYDLRHTFASTLLKKGLPITFVANQLGHSNPTMTLKNYAVWIPDDDDGDPMAVLDEDSHLVYHHV